MEVWLDVVRDAAAVAAVARTCEGMQLRAAAPVREAELVFARAGDPAFQVRLAAAADAAGALHWRVEHCGYYGARFRGAARAFPVRAPLVAQLPALGLALRCAAVRVGVEHVFPDGLLLRRLQYGAPSAALAAAVAAAVDRKDPLALVAAVADLLRAASPPDATAAAPWVLELRAPEAGEPQRRLAERFAPHALFYPARDVRLS